MIIYLKNLKVNIFKTKSNQWIECLQAMERCAICNVETQRNVKYHTCPQGIYNLVRKTRHSIWNIK